MRMRKKFKGMVLTMIILTAVSFSCNSYAVGKDDVVGKIKALTENSNQLIKQAQAYQQKIEEIKMILSENNGQIKAYQDIYAQLDAIEREAEETQIYSDINEVVEVDN